MIQRFLSNKIFKIHLLIWIAYTLYYSSLVKLFFGIPLDTAFIGQTILHRLGDILLFYFSTNVVFSKSDKPIGIHIKIPLFFIGAVGYIGYTYLLEFHIFQLLKINLPNDIPVLSKIIPRSTLQASTFIIYALGYSFAQRVIQQQIEIGKEKERNALLETEKSQTEYKFLRSQINPHFMFNTLNLIYGGVSKVDGELGDLLIQYADMMRYSTGKTMQQDEVGLKEELQFVDDFLSIQKRRFRDTLLIDYKIEGNVQSERIVPMVLFTFIENAVKHGQNDNPEFPLIIRASLVKDRFSYTVHNQKDPKPHGFDKGETGISLISLRKRLDAVYKNGGYSLTIEDLADEFIVSFVVNFKEVKK